VVLAARITGFAGGEEILISEEARSYTAAVGDWRYGRSEQLRLKGLTAPQRVHALDWTSP
jgi:class 3 adenylate cyclase